MFRVLKEDSLCLTFYGWNQADLFLDAYRAAGFRIVGHIAFRKQYAASSRYLRYQHEVAYLLAKGDAPLPDNPPSDVADWAYTGNRLHPTQKPVSVLKPFIEAYCPQGGIVLDPFGGSGTTALVARRHGRRSVLIELNEEYCELAAVRLSQQSLFA